MGERLSSDPISGVKHSVDAVWQHPDGQRTGDLTIALQQATRWSTIDKSTSPGICGLSDTVNLCQTPGSFPYPRVTKLNAQSCHREPFHAE